MKYLHWVLALTLIVPLACSQSKDGTIDKEYPLQTGDITFDPEIDDPDFKICEPNYSLQHYRAPDAGWHVRYNGDKYQLEQDIRNQYNPIAISGQSGYYTTRFLINCEGDTGLFRVESMNKSYQAFEFDKRISDQLDQIITGLEDWIPWQHEGTNYNSYLYITIKLQDGEIEKILP